MTAKTVSTDSLGRIEVARHRVRPPEGLRASRLVALLDLCAGNGICGAASCSRAGGHNWRLCI